MRRKLIGIFSCMLLIIIISIPFVEATPWINEKPVITNENDLVNNVHFAAFRTENFDLIKNILFPHLRSSYVRIFISNQNEINITVLQHIKLVGLKENRVLYEDDVYPLVILANVFDLRSFLWENDWSGYLFGAFKLIWTINIVEDDSSITKEFTGYVFNIGAIIFNPLGKVIT